MADTGFSTATVTQKDARAVNWRKRMSDNIAYALLVYTALQIVVTMGSLHVKGSSMLPYFALVVLVGAIIPACRWFEHRWDHLSAEQAADPVMIGRFRHDRLMLWLLAIGLPFGITGLFKLLTAVFG